MFESVLKKYFSSLGVSLSKSFIRYTSGIIDACSFSTHEIARHRRQGMILTPLKRVSITCYAMIIFTLTIVIGVTIGIGSLTWSRMYLLKVIQFP